MFKVFSKAVRHEPEPAVETHIIAEQSARIEPCALRVIESDDRLGNVSEGDFLFGGVQSPLAIAFISPHVDFARVAAALQRLAADTPVVAVSTAGELCSSSGSLYKPTGSSWSSVVVQVFP